MDWTFLQLHFDWTFLKVACDPDAGCIQPVRVAERSPGGEARCPTLVLLVLQGAGLPPLFVGTPNLDSHLGARPTLQAVRQLSSGVPPPAPCDSRLNHVAIAVPNLDEAAQKYRDVLGVKVRPSARRQRVGRHRQRHSPLLDQHTQLSPASRLLCAAAGQ